MKKRRRRRKGGRGNRSGREGRIGRKMKRSRHNRRRERRFIRGSVIKRAHREIRGVNEPLNPWNQKKGRAPCIRQIY